MRHIFTIQLLLFISLCTYAQPANDLCSGAIALPVDGSCQVFDNTNATTSNNPRPLMHCSFNLSNAEDIWFKLTAPASGNFTIELSSISGSGPSNMIMELYNGPCSSLNLIECSYYKIDNNDSRMPIIEREGMTSGMDYYIRISAENFSDFGQFTICVTDQGYNQFPCKIEFVEASAQSTCDPVNNTYTQELTIHYRDILGTANSIFILDQDYPITTSPLIVNVPNVPANSGWQSVSPQFRPFNKEGDLYIFNGFQRNQNCFNGSVPNDDCAGAIALTPDNMCVAFTGNNVGATHSGTAGFCEPFTQGAQDVWFQHTVTSTDDIIVNVWDGTDVQPSVIIYKGSCGQLNYQDCAFNYLSGRLTGLSIGETIYIQVKDANDDGQGDFNICLIYPVPTTNDICANAISIPVSTTCDLTQVFSNHFANDENNATQPPVCATYIDGHDLWYQFQVPADGVLSVGLDAAIIGDNLNVTHVGEMYEGSCGSLQFIDCRYLDIQTNFEFTNRTPGEILYMRVIQDTFKPYVVCTPELSNNFCAGAEDIPVGTCIQTDNYAATPSDNPYPGLLCGSSGIGNDVWYSAVVPASGMLTVETFKIPNGLFNMNVEVYDGTGCNTLNPIACSHEKYLNSNFSDHARIELEGRTPGETIYIRVLANFGYSQGLFEICVSDAGYSEPCKIELIEPVGQSACDPATNTFTQDLSISYRHDGSATHIELLGTQYPITSSPQLISVTFPATGSSFDLFAILNDNFNFGSCYQFSSYYVRDAFVSPLPCFSGTVSNDDCINAIPLPVSKGCIQNVFDNTGATYSPEANFTCYLGDNSQDIWFTAEVPPSGELIINSWLLGQVRAAFDIFEGDCNNLNRIGDCGINSLSIRFSGRQPGEILYIAAYSSDILQQGQFGLCAIEPEVLINDVCADAIAIPVTTDCSPLVYSTHDANAENGTFNCNGFIDDSNDIWFTVEVPNSGSLTLNTEEVEWGSSNVFMEVYSGGCQSPFTTCAAANSINGHAEVDLNGIPAGTLLHVRISSIQSYLHATFTFCATDECPDNELISVPIQNIRDYETHISVSGNSIIESTATVDFDAGQEVNLLPGFEVESGALFHAFIDGCGGI